MIWFSLIWRDRTDLTTGRHNFCALDNLWTTVFVQHRDERFANRKLGKPLPRLSGSDFAGGFRSGFHRFLITRGKRAQCMLHAIPQLPSTTSGYRADFGPHEINAHAFGANQSHHLLNFCCDRRRDVREGEQMRFVKKETSYRFLRITNFRKILE